MNFIFKGYVQKFFSFLFAHMQMQLVALDGLLPRLMSNVFSFIFLCVVFSQI